MFTLIQILLYGWPSREERSANSENYEALYVHRNKAYGAYALRCNHACYLMTALGVVLGGMLSLGWGMTYVVQKKAAPAERARKESIVQLRLIAPPSWGLCDVPPPPPIIMCQTSLPDELRIPIPTPLAEMKGSTIPRFVFDERQIPATMPLPEIDEFVPCETEPKVLNMKEVISKHSYPSSCRYIHYEGSTIIRVLVSEKGEYLDYRIITEVHPILANHWSSVVKDLAFSPAEAQGEKIAFWINIPFNVKLLN
ncbi:MAG: energy transducer TonB [Bacteroidota bacterium]